MAGDGKVTRIKVARNDGTNLADYLLNLVPVNHITSDGADGNGSPPRVGAWCVSLPMDEAWRRN